MVDDRYSAFLINNKATIVPYIELPKKSTDKFEVYYQGKSLLETISFNNYGSSEYGFLINNANAQLGISEFDFPDESYVRIPFPLNLSLNDYYDGLANYNKY